MYAYIRVRVNEKLSKCKLCINISKTSLSTRYFSLDPKVAFTETTFDDAKVQTISRHMGVLPPLTAHSCEQRKKEKTSTRR